MILDYARIDIIDYYINSTGITTYHEIISLVVAIRFPVEFVSFDEKPIFLLSRFFCVRDGNGALYCFAESNLMK